MTTSLPPSPRSRFPGANLLELVRDSVSFYRRMGRECGDIGVLSIGSRRVYLVTKAEYVQEVLATQSRKFVKSSAYRVLEPVMGLGLITSNGPLHLRQRRLCQPAFHRRRMEQYAEVVLRCAANLDRERRSGETIDPYAEMCQLTLRIVGGTLFGSDLEREADEALHAADEFFEQCGMNRMRLTAVLSKFGVRYSGGRKMRDARRRLDATIYRMIDRRRSQPEGNDLLSLLVHAIDEDGDGGGMSDQQLRDEVITFLLAGYETTASIVTFAWAALAQHPVLQQKLHRELDDVLGGRAPTLDDLPRLELTRRIFQEAMRLYPPAWIFGRMATEPVQIGPYVLPAGSRALASPYVTHRREDYFPQPDAFDPDRWLPERQAHLPEFAYFPFGGGVRRCIGEPLAMVEGPLILATLGQRWRMEFASPPPRETTKTLFLRPDPSLRMRLFSRTPASFDSTGSQRNELKCVLLP